MADTWGCAICQQSHPTSVTVCPNTAASIVFRSRRTVEAVPWLGDQRNYPGHWRWQSAIERDAPSEEAKAGDWIVYDRDNRGRSCLRPVPDSAFRAAYEPVAPSPPETPAPEGSAPPTPKCTNPAHPFCDEAGAGGCRNAPWLDAASPASAPRETPDHARIALSRQASMVAATVVWLREWVERHAPFCPGGGGCAANCKPIRDALAILSDLRSAAPPEAPASAPSPALVLAEGETIAVSCARCGGAFRVGILSHPCMKTSAPASFPTNPDPEVKP